MFNDGKLNPNITITKTLEELKEELIFIQNIKLNKKLAFDKALISLDDRIVPTENQLNYWKNTKTQTETINSTHCPFEIYTTWNDLLC